MKSHMFMIKPWVLISQAAKYKPEPLSWNAVSNRSEQSWRQPSQVAVNIIPGLQNIIRCQVCSGRQNSSRCAPAGRTPPGALHQGKLPDPQGMLPGKGPHNAVADA